jgi:hypothetical protein
MWIRRVKACCRRALVEPVIESLGSRELLPDGLWNPWCFPPNHHLDRLGEQPEHPPRPKTWISRRTGARML